MNILAIDIGGTFIKYAYFENKKLIFNNKLKSEGDKGAEYIIKNVDDLIENILRDNNLDGIAVSSAGIVDPEKGNIIHASHTIPNYKGFNWKNYIKNKYNLRLEIDNDVNCAALGELSIGSVKNKDNILMLSIGTGIGGAFIKNGEIYRGANKCGLEVGYMNIEGGNFEDLASTTALLKKYNELSKNKINGYELFDLAKNGDEKAIESIEFAMENLAKGISNITYIIDPSFIVLGGGIMEQEDYLEPIIKKYLKKYMIPLAYENCKLVFAKAGNLASCYGALYNFNKKLEEYNELF